METTEREQSLSQARRRLGPKGNPFTLQLAPCRPLGFSPSGFGRGIFFAKPDGLSYFERIQSMTGSRPARNFSQVGSMRLPGVISISCGLTRMQQIKTKRGREENSRGFLSLGVALLVNRFKNSRCVFRYTCYRFAQGAKLRHRFFT